MDSVVGHIRAPEFPSDLDWINVEAPPSLRRLRGKIVLLDFWTSCCINCHHDIPPLRSLAREFAKTLVVVGVHSPKFDAERSTENLRQAVLRFDIEYPIVNDADHRIRSSYTVKSWPTTLLIDPEGRIRAEKRGEIDFDSVAERIELMARHFERRGLLDLAPFLGAPERRHEPERPLSFPAGLATDGERLFVADTGHHRVLELRLLPGRAAPQTGTASSQTGTASSQTGTGAEWVRTFGGGRPGLVDGSAEGARFHHPHGLVLDGDQLFVADTDNHALRRIDLATGAVSTLAGTGQKEPHPWVGRQPDPRSDEAPLRGPAADTPLRSPWGLCLEAPGRLLVAMAGSHQVWRLHLGPEGRGSADSTILELVAGNGREALEDGVGPRASFDQPSGLTAAHGSQGGNGAPSPISALFVADAEASAVRRVDPASARVETVIGTGLFDFGDRDGVGEEALLQHPTDLAWLEGHLYIADSYNHKIRRLDLHTRDVRSLAGNGVAGAEDGVGEEARFFEPEAILADPLDRRLFVADTNNHQVRIVRLPTDEESGSGAKVTTLEISERQLL